MTYAATASVHAFALLLRYRYCTPTLNNLDWIYLPPDELGDIDLQWVYGKEDFRTEQKELRTKENSVMNGTGEFFRQCAKPFTHSWNSTLHVFRQLKDYWMEFKEWHNDPVGVSTLVLAQHALSGDDSIEVKVHLLASVEDRSSLETKYEHATPQQVSLPAFATLPTHMPLSHIGSYRSKTKLATRWHSQS